LSESDFEATICEVAETGSILGWMKIYADETDLHDKVEETFSRYAYGLLTHLVEKLFSKPLSARMWVQLLLF